MRQAIVMYTKILVQVAACRCWCPDSNVTTAILGPSFFFAAPFFLLFSSPSDWTAPGGRAG